MAALTYPPAPRDDSVVESLHGGRVTFRDPFRPLEAPAETPAVAEWVAAEQRTTAAYLGRHAGLRGALRARAEALQSYARTGCPTVRAAGSVALLSRNSGLQPQDVVYALPRDVADADALPEAGAFDAAAGARPLLDPAALDASGTTALSSSSLSESGRLWAYGLSRGGSDWQTVHVRDVASGADLPDVIPWAKFTSMSWLPDDSGFFYVCHPPPPELAAAGADSRKAGTETAATEHAMVRFHRVGTAAEADLLVWANPAQPVWRYGTSISDDGEWLFVSTHKGTDPVVRLYCAHLPTVWPGWSAAAAPLVVPPGGVPPPAGGAGAHAYLPLTRLVDNFEADYDVVANVGARLFLRTNLGAPRYRVVALDAPTAPPAGALADAPAPGAPGAVDGPTPAVVDAVPEDAGGGVLDWAAAVGARGLLLCYMRDVVNSLELRALPDAAAAVAAAPAPLGPGVPVPLPGPGTIAAASARAGAGGAAFVKFVSFLSPGTILRVCPDAAATGGAGAASAPPAWPGAAPTRVTTWLETRVGGFDPAAYEAAQHFVTARDGATRLPVFVVRRRAAAGAPRAEPAPALLYGYGGFNISLQPSFSALRLAWLGELGGVFALACLRGGGEYGEEWHAAGTKTQKQNVFNDFADIAAWLVAERVTTPAQLAVMGGSNGGLLVLAAALQGRATAFAAGVSQVPVADMMRFHKHTVGALWRGEYGYAEESEAEAAALLAYSPLHNVPTAAELDGGAAPLPALLLTTADHDDRVVPLHSFKMAAALQAGPGASAAQTRPLLVRIETQAGHGAGKPTALVLDEWADTFTFIAVETGAKFVAAK